MLCKEFQLDVTIHGLAEPWGDSTDSGIVKVKSLKEHGKRGFGA
ncbi:MAG: hypothetical protein JWM08_1702 [Candidatus Angelobacter sp.]|nr:hypothetical protein [Candidatus Angelobacter sp.]